ncbi:S-layer homology domain-containing protein [Inediibacterium massiliense]|uniref:S-layer homology domain-containing protein n=1 Tax=Inediibacterium massiliense TaxID=1658111 RepID=UPI0006B48D7D|nr:S-layer homology domain-containing protein [Inediibacterium massiliense]
MKKKILCGIITGAFIVANTMASFAAINFSDVPNNHWAKEYINKMADKKIISGYFDDYSLKTTFKPDQSVTYIEAMQMIYNTLKISNKLKSNSGLTAKYSTVMNQNKVPDWAKDAVAYGLEYGIIRSDDLKIIIKNGKQVSAKKVDIAVFIGKAIDMKDQIDPLPVLTFTDAESISTVAKPYVDLLEKKKIIGGDEKKRFNPNSIVNRAVMATMCSKTYDLLGTQTSVVTPPVENNTNTDNTNTNNINNGSKVLQRIISYISLDANMIMVKGGEEKEEVYNLKGVTILINGKTKAMKDLNKGDGIKLIYNKNGELDTVEVDNAVTTWYGKVEKLEKKYDYDLLTVRNTDNLVLKKEIQIDNNTEMKYDGKKISTDRLIEGEEIKVKFIGDKAITIELQSKEKIYEGILESSVLFKEKPILKFRTNSNKVLELEIEDRPTIRKDRRKVELDELSKGDIATITVHYDKVVEVIAASREERTRDEGVIKQIIIGDPTKITILTDDKETRTYEVSNGVDVKIDDENKKLNDLDIHYDVTLRLENNKIIKIEAKKAANKDNITGEVIKVYSKYNRITVKNFDPVKKEYVTTSVTVTDDTKIWSFKGDPIKIGHLREDTTIFIDGYDDDGMFVANRIIELN